MPESRHYKNFCSETTTDMIEALLQASSRRMSSPVATRWLDSPPTYSGLSTPQPDPAQRLGSHLLGAEVRVHPYFWGLSWEDLEARKVVPPHK